jgi:carboxymethylenebutenolidase
MTEGVVFPTLSGSAQGRFAAATAPGPGLLLLPDVAGLDPPLLDAAERLARSGVPTLVVDLLGGQGAWWGEGAEDNASRFLARDPAAVADDLNGAARFLLDHPLVTGGTVSVAGADSGGAVALWAATVSPRIRAASAAYPARSLWSFAGIRPEALAGRHTFLHLAADDPEFGPADARRLQATGGGGGGLTVHTYPGTQRGFMDEFRPDRYDAAAAQLVWERIRAMVTAAGANGADEP